MKEQIKELRISIDGLAQLTKELKPMDCNTHNAGLKNNSKEIEKCYNSLILAKAWLGKVLGELGEETPYKNDGNRKTVEDIKPTVDVHKFSGEIHDVCFQQDWLIMTHIEKVDWLRQEIEKVRIESHKIQDCGTPISGLLAWNFVYQHLCEARFQLGFELQRVKENN